MVLFGHSMIQRLSGLQAPGSPLYFHGRVALSFFGEGALTARRVLDRKEYFREQLARSRSSIYSAGRELYRGLGVDGCYG